MVREATGGHKVRAFGAISELPVNCIAEEDSSSSSTERERGSEEREGGRRGKKRKGRERERERRKRRERGKGKERWMGSYKRRNKMDKARYRWECEIAA